MPSDQDENQENVKVGERKNTVEIKEVPDSADLGEVNKLLRKEIAELLQQIEGKHI